MTRIGLAGSSPAFQIFKFTSKLLGPSFATQWHRILTEAPFLAFQLHDEDFLLPEIDVHGSGTHAMISHIKASHLTAELAVYRYDERFERLATAFRLLVFRIKN